MKDSELNSSTTDQNKNTDAVTDGVTSEVVDVGRRKFMATSALLGAAGTIGLGLNSTAVQAESGGLNKGCMSGFKPLEVDSPMARWKKPQSVEFVEKATKNYSFPNWQSGNGSCPQPWTRPRRYLLVLALAPNLGPGLEDIC